MKSFKFVLLYLILCAKISSAQKTELVNSGDLIKKCAELYDSSKYKEALPLLNKVNRSDTNYVWSLYEKALDCEADSQYTAAIKYCREALALKEQREYEPELYNTYGNTLDDMGQYDNALHVFGVAIAKYPAYALFYFNTGVVYMAQKRPADAEPWFQKALLINPYLYSAHYQLGLAALQQGKIIPAFLSFTAYLLVHPSGKYWSKSINYLSKISKSTDDILEFKNKRTTQPDENYQAVEDIVLSKIALDQSYKSRASIEDPIVRQTQAIFEKLEYNDTNKDFWIQYYLPYFKQIYDNKFGPFIFHTFSNVNVPVIQDYVKKNKKELDAFVNDAAVYFDIVRSTRELFYKKRDTITEKYLFDDGKLAGKGTLANKGAILTGRWVAYYPAGNIKGAGNYNAAGGREGEWLYYFYTGGLKAKEHYQNGKEEGVQEYYFDNGNPSSRESYADGKAEGLVTAYYYAGNVKSTAYYKLGKKDGEEKEHYSNGNLSSVNHYVNGILTGITHEYYKSGPLKTVQQYVNGKVDGLYKSYYESGGVSSEGQFVKDNAAGEWKFYYENGKIKETHSYLNNMEEGPHLEYFENGQVSASFSSKKAKADGEATWCYKDGKPFSTYIYDRGSVKTVKYFDGMGKQVSFSQLKGDFMDIVIYSRNGYKKAHGTYDTKGDLQGPDTLFYPSGKVSGIDHYRNDTLNGVSVTYYLNGNKKTEINTNNGKDDGYYTSYYVNGQLESEGWMQDGGSQGEWAFYDEKGRLTGRSYYLDGDLDGYKEEYFPDGKKNLEEKYHRGWLERMTQYDDAGNALTVDTFPKMSGKYTLLYPDKKIMSQVNYVNGDFDGPYKSFYFDGTVESSYFYKKGVLDSTYRTYHYGGGKNDEGQYKYGSRWGIWKYYDEDGKLYSTTEYKNDEKNGVKTYYALNGNKDYLVEYKDDMLNGDARRYDDDGTLEYQITYEDDAAKTYTYLGKDGKLVPIVPIAYNNGSLKAYYPNGKLSRECVYSDGKVNGQDIIYYGTGQVKTADTCAYGLFNGRYRAYNPNGKLKSEYNYIADDAYGIAREFDENGSLKQEIAYENGVEHGPAKYYDKNGKLVKTMLYYYGKLISVKNE